MKMNLLGQRKMNLRQFSLTTTWTKILLVFIALWGISVFVFILKSSGTGGEVDSAMEQRLTAALDYIQRVDDLNADLRNLVDDYISDSSSSKDKLKKFAEQVNTKLELGSRSEIDRKDSPHAEYEQLRRRVKTNIHEFWSYVQAEAKTLHQGGKNYEEFMELAREHEQSLLNDMNRLKETDGFERWRRKEAQDLSDLVQRRLAYLQNPKDCQSARKLVCRLNKGCGWGCQLHHLVYCFIMAYATERTMILKSKGWRYHKGGWEEVFKPVSESCLDSDGESHATWPGTSETQVITLPIIDSLNPRPSYLPLAIPADLAPRLTRLHGEPIVWWIGQFIKYLLRPQPKTQELLDNSIDKLHFQKPIVGVHVRRTDKIGTEAAFHSLEEYMKYVDEYYDKLDMVKPLSKRRVFIASDDPKVINEAKLKYTSYEVIGDPNIAKIAAVSTRYTDASLNGIIIDIHLLSLSDYLVCTFSSQVCRVAYEIMQTMHVDATDRFKSLDDIYYYGGQNAHNRVAVLPHTAKQPEQINIKKNDLIGIAGNHWNGFSKGRNERTHQAGLFPSFKVVDKVQTADFPTYPYVK